MKVKLTQRFWVRAVAFFLCAIVLAAAVGCGILFLYGESENWYGGETLSYFNTQRCKWTVWERMQQLCSNYYFNHEDTNWCASVTAPGGMGNIMYVLFDGSGELLLTNVREGDGGVQVLFDEHINGYTSYPYGNYIVRAYVDTDMEYEDSLSEEKRLFDTVYPLRWAAVGAGAALLLTAVALFTFLICSAGHTADREEPVLLRQDRIPLDLYLAGAAALEMLMCVGIADLEWAFHGKIMMGLVCGALLVLGMAVVFVGTCMTLAARFKVGGWWRNAVIYMVLRLLWKCAKCVCRRVGQFIRALPVIWRTALGAGAVLFVNFLGLVSYRVGFSFGDLLLLVFDFAVAVVLCACAVQFRRLRRGVKALADGSVNEKLELRGLYLDFHAFGEDLNRVSEGMGRAVEERLKSERMKTELITNVSHDLKTPLTSIISYVDLLKKEPLGSEKAGEYVDVLDRQAHKLKKLTDDLVEVSKASSGNMKAELARMDVREMLQQSIGEYAGRMENAGLTPVVRMPEAPVNIMADGRLLWRVFENLLQNICKYSMSGTRVWFDVHAEHGRVFITAKNISAEQLDFTAEELMSRFVRGDTSRSTEGSGLGLSIARSLTQLQGGEFSLYLDGDMFKVMIIFPVAQEPFDKTGA